MNTTFKQSRESELTPEVIESYVRRGRELRAQAIAHGIRRVVATLRWLHGRTTGNAPDAAECV